MSLDALLAEMQALESKGDLRGIVKLRARIAAEHPDTPEAAEALFRLGLYFLFVESQPQAAMQTFEQAIKIKDPNWSKAARVSLASLYLREQKPQKALLELRKALGEKEPPSIHTVSALSIMEAVHEQSGDAAEARKTKTEKVRHLEVLLQQAVAAADDAAVGYFTVSLAHESLGLGRPAEAKQLAQQVVAMTAARAGQSAVHQAQALLKVL